MQRFSLKGNITNIIEKQIFYGEIIVEKGKIKSINKIDANINSNCPFILPGFVDSHVHIESSMLIPAEFAKLAVVHGTVATVSDPHEIGNVCGLKGIEFMIENGKTVPFKFNFGAPSCVPATYFETAGAEITASDIENLLAKDDIKYLTEMMNFPGVLNADETVMKKIAAAHLLNKPVDGHAPGLRGTEAQKYIDAGISTDHECFTKEEAEEKLKYGMKILIREGSAAKNFEALIDLLNDYEDMMMFCSDDKHPDSLEHGHINELCARAVAKGIDIFKILKAACINPVLHYKLNVGLLQHGDAADFIVVDDLKKFKVLQTYIDGNLVAENGISKVETNSEENVITSVAINNFSCSVKTEADIKIMIGTDETIKTIKVIEALDGQLITNKIEAEATILNGEIVPNVENDILKIVVVNRYKNAPVAKAFIKNFGLKRGAIASSVAHDSHNIVAVGVDDRSICKAINLVIENKGGVSLFDEKLIQDDTDFIKRSCSLFPFLKNGEAVLPLPVAGLMSNKNGYEVAEAYTCIDQLAKYAGSRLSAPYMTLSFMSLLVIPHLKLSDLGLFDGDTFKFIH